MIVDIISSQMTSCVVNFSVGIVFGCTVDMHQWQMDGSKKRHTFAMSSNLLMILLSSQKVDSLSVAFFLAPAMFLRCEGFLCVGRRRENEKTL